MSIFKFNRFLFFILLGAGCSRSDDSAASWDKLDVEVSPGVFVSVAEKYESNDRPISFGKLHSPGGAPRGKLQEETELRVPWQGREVKWKGAGRPITLRAKDNLLYFISFDRTTRGIEAADFRYFAQDKDGFREISRSDFPRSIASQNMSFWYRHENCDGAPRDQVQIARDVNPVDVCFRSSLTAYLWGQLATGKSYMELQRQ